MQVKYHLPSEAFQWALTSLVKNLKMKNVTTVYKNNTLKAEDGICQSYVNRNVYLTDGWSENKYH